MGIGVAGLQVFNEPEFEWCGPVSKGVGTIAEVSDILAEGADTVAEGAGTGVEGAGRIAGVRTP